MSNITNNNPVEIKEKAALKAALEDVSRSFDKDELDRIIHEEFFNEEAPFCSEIVDAAIRRRLLMDGIALDDDTMQRKREQLIYGVLKEIFKTDK